MDELCEVAAKDVRLPREATDALSEGRPVLVTRYGKPIHVLMPEDRFHQVLPLLEALSEGVTLSPEMQMTKADIDLMRDLADDREVIGEEEEQISELLARSEG